MPLSRDELERIARLRELFLDEAGEAARRDYWRDAADVRAYGAVLAARIGWKWDAALAECSARGFGRADEAVVLDFGCGSGIAAERFVRTFGAREVLCHDRSALAMAHAADAVTAVSGVAAKPLPAIGDVAFDVLLASHVLGELDDCGLDTLRELCRRARRIVIVEPGNRAIARRLSQLRGELLADFRIVAPCPHAAYCPALATEDDWCHFFAAPPPHVFTDGEWVQLARQVGIDLRALPYAFLALERAAIDAGAPAPPSPQLPRSPRPPHRLLGRPEIGKHAARVRLCTADGMVQRMIDKRTQRTVWRELAARGGELRQLPDGG